MSSVESLFKYKNVSSESYCLRIVNIDTSESGNQIEANATYEQRALNRQHKFLAQSRKHEDPFEFELELFSEDPISVVKQREIVQWLFDSPTFGRLEFLDDEYSGIHYMAILTSEEQIVGGDGLHGWKVKVLCDAPYAWEDIATKTFSNLSSGSTFTFANTSDEIDYMYATIKLTVGSTGGTVTLQNTSNGNQLITINNTRANESITIDPYGQLTSSTKRSCYDDYSGGIMRLVHGNNVFVTSGNITKVEITYQNARRVGY